MIKMTIQKLDRQLLRNYEKKFAGKTNSLRRFLLDSPTQYSDVFQHYDLTSIYLGTRSFKTLVGLAVMSWYMPDEIGILIRLNLEELEWPAEKFLEKELLLTSKDVMLGYLILQERWNGNDFFGNVLNLAANLYRRETTWFQQRSRRSVKRYSGYCRGYQESHRMRKRLPRELLPSVVEVADDSVWEAIKISIIQSWIREIGYLLRQYESAS